MKSIFLLSLALGIVSGSAAQPASVPMSMRTVVPVSATNTDNAAADKEHEALWSAWRAKPAEGLTRTNRAYWEWQDKVFKKFAEDATSFAEKYPKDPRRWEAIVQSGYTHPWFIKGFKPEFDTQPREGNLILDEAALTAFNERQAKLTREVMLADDATPRQRIGALGWLITETQAAARKISAQPDLGKFQAVMIEVADKLPDERGATLLEAYLSVYRQASAADASAFEAKLAGKPIVTAMKELSAKQEKARADAAQATTRAAADIGTLKFKAADGREVDLAKLRGKVILIDFWATWCGPCIKEIPNVVANYEKYHDRGFEVIGITLENSGVTESDSQEAKDKKLAVAREKMLAFTKKNQMPWPQHYDGKYWSSEYAVKYGIHAIPAMFLLDKDGKVVSTQARGPVLEAEIKRLLGL